MPTINSRLTQTQLRPNEFGVCEYHLSLYRGDSFGFELTGEFDSVDFENAQFSMQIVGNTGEIITPNLTKTDKGVQIKITPAMSKNTHLTSGKYDLQMMVGDDVFTLLMGKVRITGDVTD